jgi:class 3 adenylate cyclase
VRQLGPLAKTLLAVWLVVWLGALGLYATHLLQGRVGRNMLLLTPAEGPDDYPTLLGVRVRAGSLEQIVAGAPRPQRGDRLLRVGEADLRGANQFRFEVLAVEQTGPDLHVSLLLERDGQRLETWVEAWRRPFPWVALLFSLSFGATGLLLIDRAPRFRAARFLAAGLMAASLAQPDIWFLASGHAELHYARSVFNALAAGAYLPLFISGLLLLPDEGRSTSRWMLAWPWLFSVNLFFAAGNNVGVGLPYSLAWRPLNLIAALGLMTALGISAWSFVHANAIARRRYQWVWLGIFLSSAPGIFRYLTPLLLTPASLVRFWRAAPLLELAYLFIPLSLLIAILRFDLFDIDRLISATAAVTLAGIAVVAGLFAGLPAASAAVASLTGIDTGTSQLALSLLAAGIGVPVARRLRPQIERVLFAERHRIDRGVQALMEGLGDSREPRALIERVGESLTEVFRPEACVVYARRGATFSPVFVRGSGGPPAFETASPLATTLGQRSAPLAIERFAAKGGAGPLTPFDRAALEALEASVVVPIHHRTAGLVAFVSLGPKHSGDVYTSTDLTLLSALAHEISGELLRFEQEALTRQAEVLRESLRVYVPGAVQAQLARAGEAVAGEREVAVLFVDIRGYTAFAEDRAAAEIFSAVNRYTRAVSEIVKRHHGSVVEFNGDGMMAVFGAPEALPGKEREALETALEVVAAMPALDLRTRLGEALAVGVGIATGQAFVGNVQSADRAIWTALGNTTNRAARFQGLTRELAASVVTDAATHAAAGAAARGFERRERVAIRGRREPEDLFVLPLAATEELGPSSS